MPLDWGADPGSVGDHGHGADGGDPARRVVDPAMDSLRTAVTALVATDAGELSREQREARIVAVEQLSAMLGAHQLACIDVFDARGEAAASGAASTQAWLRHWVRMAPGTAKARVTLARRLRDQLLVADELAAGTISVRHAEEVARTVDDVASHLDGRRQRVPQLQTDLLEVAKLTDPTELHRVCLRWRKALVPDAAAADDWAAFEQRDLSLSRTFAGLGAIDGVLDPVSTETVAAAIHALSAPAGANDTRTAGQRRADALTEICRRVLTFTDLPTNGGERPHVLVTAELSALEGRAGYTAADLAWAGPISGELARAVACDANVTRIITQGPSQPLDVGRSTRVVPPAIRRALLVRDKTCRYPGCTVPGQWAEAHHRTHWINGGRTALDNLVLLCGFHHLLIHARRQRVDLRPDGSVVILPDGAGDDIDMTERPGIGPLAVTGMLMNNRDDGPERSGAGTQADPQADRRHTDSAPPPGSPARHAPASTAGQPPTGSPADASPPKSRSEAAESENPRIARHDSHGGRRVDDDVGPD